jgi:hypothetical protein
MYPNLTESLDALMAPLLDALTGPASNTAHPASTGPVLSRVPAAGARTGTGMLPPEVRP